MKKYLILLLSLSFFSQTNAQKSEDIKAIKGQCGCFEVDFKYAETFSPTKDYKYHDRYHVGGLEWVFVDEESKDKLVLMHLLVINDKMVIKHWREDWQFENTNLLAYQQKKDWKATEIVKTLVKGQWSQKIFEVDDSPRYEGTATWTHKDGKHTWANITDAPLPRREYTKRSDYQVMRRHNRIHVTEKGYLHEQDNDKLIRNETGDQLLAQEKGFNDYVKTDESKCALAKTWWLKQRAFWADVRGVWSELITQNKGISLKTEKIDGVVLMQAIDNLSEKPDVKREEIKTTILKFVNNAELYSMR